MAAALTTGVGAVLNTAKVEQGATAAVFGLGSIGLNVIQGLKKMAGADMIIGVDINDSKKAWGERFGMTHFVNPTKIDGDVVAHRQHDQARRRPDRRCRLHVRPAPAM